MKLMSAFIAILFIFGSIACSETSTEKAPIYENPVIVKPEQLPHGHQKMALNSKQLVRLIEINLINI